MNASRRLMAALVAAFVLLAGGVAVAAPASAYGYTCNDRINGYVPAYNNGLSIVDGGFATQSCYQNSGRYRYASTVGIQKSFNKCYAERYGWSKIAVDGIYGSKTTAAVAKVQRKHGITDDGKYGPQTASYFRSYVVNSYYNGSCFHWTP
ncbi:peptidoglycan-binding protein [Isoptericola sp. b408]|uniref:peptidoglycan-binding domain-containing protein n=1 Tax=Isoptericola sp. b408 TaxID=3064653 RepID=UPI0027130F4D|nr:peptidoglycan-binding protein [Isoptericola sp. b408]MDO8152269.1 peptidoglycan-binding domain-containing protein [Isoptericola sp. b408]